MPQVWWRRVRARGSALGLLATGLVLSAASGHAQQSTPQAPAPPVFRGGTTFVSVDVYPRIDGTVVEGLEAGDFEVFEDGERQAVEAFQFIRIDPNPPDSERRDPNTKADGDRQAADPRNRVFVVYLDLTHTTVGGSYYARQPVLDFLTRTIGTNDLFGVMTAETPVSQLVFGRRTETLASELEKYWPWGQADRMTVLPRTPQEERLVECGTARGIDALLITLWREDQMMTSLENLALRLGDLRDERKNVLFISEGWVPQGPRTDLANLNVSRGAVPQVGVGPGGRIGVGQTQQPFYQDASSCDAEIRRLASIDFDQRFRDLLASARQANVSFYPVDVGGLRTTPVRATDTLRTLAENTDGFAVVSTNDLTGGVRRIQNDLAAFYLLGYYSTNTAANGRYRAIEVKVNRPGVRVSARRGYLAPTAEMLAAAAAPRASSGPSAVDTALARLATARADTDLFVAGTATPNGVHVAVELGANAAARPAWRDGATVQAIVTAADGSTTSADIEMAAGVRAGDVVVPAGTGPWQLVVMAAGTGDERLQQRIEVAALASRLVGPPLAWRAAASPRAPLRPLADARLTRLERLRVEWPVVADDATRVVRLLDRTGKPLGQPLPITSLAPAKAAVALDLPMGSLPEGDFVIELVATQGGVSEQQLLAFRVVR